MINVTVIIVVVRPPNNVPQETGEATENDGKELFITESHL